MDTILSNNSIAVSPTLSQEGGAGNSPHSEKVTEKFPIVSDSSPQQEDQKNNQTKQPERPNKYLYPTFAGYSGERYLDSILQHILPNALSRTWRYAVDFQKPGNPCYVGAARISQRVKPGVRKIEMDLHELEARGLMRRYAARQPVLREDGTVRNEAVVVKDFSALYALAYEYHLWTQSPEYIPPERDYVDLIYADHHLYHKLIRFDNYRRLLQCAKPGTKTQTTDTQFCYQCQLPLDDQTLVSPPPGKRTPAQNTNKKIKKTQKVT